MPLAFCLLASLWLNLPYLPSDFCRWAMNGSLPTYSCYTKLPRKSSYKLFFKQTVCFHVDILLRLLLRSTWFQFNRKQFEGIFWFYLRKV